VLAGALLNLVVTLWLPRGLTATSLSTVYAASRERGLHARGRLVPDAGRTDGVEGWQAWLS
jgi:hypothetical protein